MTPQLTSQKQKHYTVTGLIKGTVSLDELRTLLLHWRPDEKTTDFADRVQREGILTKQTSKRVKDLVLSVFQPWFLLPDTRGAMCLKAFVEADGDHQSFNELVFLYKARSEKVLFDFVQEYFWPACQDGALYLRTQDIEDFLSHAQDNGFSGKPWSSSTQGRLARGILGALLRIGFLRQEKRYQYDYVFYRPGDFTITYLAHDLHFSGMTDNALVEHPDWGLFGLSRSQVLERLAQIDKLAGMILQQAGSVVRITWLYNDMEGLIRAYFGRNEAE